MSVKFNKNGLVHDAGECLRGLNLLGHAQLIELELGSTCGGHGKCGKDRIQLTVEGCAKVNDPTEIERFHIKDEEILNGVRLACQCFPNSNSLEIFVKLC